MNITLFGGSFNPPHIGHQVVISQAFELIKGLDELWLLPDYKHSFFKGKLFTDSQHRLAMTKMLETPTSPRLRGASHVKTQTCCLDQQMTGYTIDHLTYLTKKYPKHKFSFLLGSDNLKSFHKWHEYKKLLKLLHFYVYPRANCPFKPLYPNMEPLEHPMQAITNISSTMIRNKLKNKLPINHLVPASIANYLKTNSLYA
jgi:nicotinate-nucleotide adenylyltransferase